MGQFSVEQFQQRMEQPGRADEESACAGSQSIGIKFWFRQRRGRSPVCRGRGYGDGRIDHLAVVALRGSGPQTYGGTGQSEWHYPDF